MAAAVWGSSTAPAAVAAIKWPLFNGDVCDFPAFVAKRKKIRSSCEIQLKYHRPCGYMYFVRNVCATPALARRLAYFFTVRQIWDFLGGIEKPCLALEESLAVLNKHQPLKDDDSEGLPVHSTSGRFWG